MKIRSKPAHRAAAGVALACTITSGMAADTAAAAAPPPEAFFNGTDLGAPELSPDGTALAIRVAGNGKAAQLAIIDTADPRNVRTVAEMPGGGIKDAHWVNDKRLVFRLHDPMQSDFQAGASGLFAVDRTDAEPRQLVHGRSVTSILSKQAQNRVLDSNLYFSRTLADGTDDVIVERMSFAQTVPIGEWGEVRGTTPLRLNTRTGLLTPILTDAPPEHAEHWLVDDHGRIKAAVADEGKETILLVPDGAGKWTERARFPSPATGVQGVVIEPAVAADGSTYIQRAASDAAGGRALYRIDLQTGKPAADPLLNIKGFDVGADFVEDAGNHRLLGIRYENDAAGTAWLDADMKALQAKVDAKLPGLANRIDIARCGCAPRVLVTATSDHQPATFFLYDRATDALVLIGSSHAVVKASQMADTDFVRIKARDGHDLPVYVTKPKGKGPWPTVVLAHDGPWQRGAHWAWVAEPQFLASRGYLVVQPEFRGSQGYGAALHAAGFGQTGLGAQDDIADATRWAIGQGLADAPRVCIAGKGYGGYAALMGLVRYPDLYRCGVAMAAAFDVETMAGKRWGDTSSADVLAGIPARYGDPAGFAAVSPSKLATRISHPVMLVHGVNDRRESIRDALAMRSALESAHAPVTWVEYKDEGRDLELPSTQVDLHRRMEVFLAENIGAQAAAGAASK